jgi:MoxR-like ATPase
LHSTVQNVKAIDARIGDGKGSFMTSPSTSTTPSSSGADSAAQPAAPTASTATAAPAAAPTPRKTADAGAAPAAGQSSAAPARSREDADLAAVDHLKSAYARINAELSKVIVGQQLVIDELLISIFTRSHALLVGVPGLAKTLLISSLSQTLKLQFKRVQFTPDLMPSDITGTEVIYSDPATNERTFKFLKGPIFSNIILADEINRTPPKTQAAMLEAMQERKVTVGGADHKLPEPFFVLATQNPVEQEGTYPLPEAQLDRFMFMILVDYPSAEEERKIMKMATSPSGQQPQPVLSSEHIMALQQIVRRVPVADHVFAYAERLVRVTRPKTPEALDFCKKWLNWGAGPRASLNLIMAAKAKAILAGRYHVNCDDVANVAVPIFRHRLVPNFAAQSEGVTSDDITRKILAAIPKDKKLD